MYYTYTTYYMNKCKDICLLIVYIYGTLNGANYFAIAIGGIGSNDNHYNDNDFEDVEDNSNSNNKQKNISILFSFLIHRYFLCLSFAALLLFLYHKILLHLFL